MRFRMFFLCQVLLWLLKSDVLVECLILSVIYKIILGIPAKNMLKYNLTQVFVYALTANCHFDQGK